jgi:hypothetical protein
MRLAHLARARRKEAKEDKEEHMGSVIPLQTPVTVSREIAGRTLKLESGKIGRQAGAAVMVTYGETMVFVAATEGPGKEGQDFVRSGQDPGRLLQA